MPKPRKPRYTLVDGEQANAEHPDTFWMPEKTAREALRPGQIVKCIFQSTNEKEPSERMWVLVHEKLPDGSYRGELNNHPTFIHAKAGDAVSFSAKHVIQIYEQQRKAA